MTVKWHVPRYVTQKQCVKTCQSLASHFAVYYSWQQAKLSPKDWLLSSPCQFSWWTRSRSQWQVHVWIIIKLKKHSPRWNEAFVTNKYKKLKVQVLLHNKWHPQVFCICNVIVANHERRNWYWPRGKNTNDDRIVIVYGPWISSFCSGWLHLLKALSGPSGEMLGRLFNAGRRL